MFFTPQLLFPVCFEHGQSKQETWKGVHFVELVFKCKIKLSQKCCKFSLEKALAYEVENSIVDLTAA